jgi:CBS domain-containing protein
MPARALPTFRFNDGTCIAQAQPQQVEEVTLDTPALAVMTDLTQIRAATVHPELSLDQAEQKMIHQGVRMLFVVASMPCVDGVVTAEALRGERPMRLIQQRGVRRSELCVADVMNKLSELDVVDLAAVKRSRVGDIVATLVKFGRPHLLVVEAATRQSAPRIRGLISHSALERQLGHAVPMVEIASSFMEVELALA